MLQMPRLRLFLKHFSEYSLSMRSCTSRSVSLASKTKSTVIECLDNRGLVKVSGKEASLFMQGLITNDMKHLEEGAPSMYTMFLNTKGRVMLDAIIYRSREEDSFLIECDKASLQELQKHLKLYRVRRKINVENIDDKLKVWVIFDYRLYESEYGEIADGQIISNATQPDNNELVMKDLENRNDIIACRDPRLSVLGVRILAPSSEDVTLKDDGTQQVDKLNYRAFRYKLGIGEGVNDLPPGNCFPLEANGDYLHGVSFHKGCYIGQELTARTHHTGVIRKRLMPLFFDSTPEIKLEANAPIRPPSGCNKTSIGKLRGVEQDVGLALLRVAEALDVANMSVQDVTAQTMKPSWWPQEAPKERVSVGKTN